MVQRFTVNLDTLEASLDIQEEGKEASYRISLEPDRSNCFIERVLFDDMESGDPVAAQSWIRSLEEVKDDATLNPAVMWICRGLWGIPLSFGPKPDAARQGSPVAEESAPEKPAPRRSPRK